MHQFSKPHWHACAADIASRVNYGQQTFLRFPENLLNSRARYAKAFQVSFLSSDFCLCPGCLSVCLFIHLPVSICVCICLFVCSSICLLICVLASLHACLSVYLSVYDMSGSQNCTTTNFATLHHSMIACGVTSFPVCAAPHIQSRQQTRNSCMDVLQTIAHAAHQDCTC